MKKIPAKLSWRRMSLGFSLVLAAGTLVSTLWPPFEALSAPGWTSPEDISHTTYGSFSPALALDSQGYSHAVWYGDGETQSDWSIWYANNRSGSWSAPKKITTGSNLKFPKIAVDSSDVLHVVYEDRGVNQIMYTHSTDHGQTWSSKFNLSASPNKAYAPDIAVDLDGNQHAVWIDNRWTGAGLYQLAYAKRTNGSWSGATRLQHQIGFNNVPALTTTGSGANLFVHVVFQGKPEDSSDNKLNEIYYIRGTNSSWEDPRNLSQSADRASYTPAIASSGPNGIYLAWDESPPSSSHDIFLVRSVDNGANWSSPHVVTQDLALSRFPAIAYGLDKAHLVYDSDTAGAGDVFYVSYNPVNGSLSTPLNLAATAGSSKEADLAVDACRMAVVWMDRNDAWDILYTTTPEIPPGPCPPTPTPTPRPPLTPLAYLPVAPRQHDVASEGSGQVGPHDALQAGGSLRSGEGYSGHRR